MAQTIKIKNGTGTPGNGDVVKGELALNTDTGNLYYGDTAGNVASIRNPYVISTFAFYMGSFTPDNYYYGNGSHGNFHHQFNGNWSGDPDGALVASTGVQHNGITVPFATTNIGLKGVVQGPTAGNTCKYILYKGTRQGGGGTPTLTEIGSDTATVAGGSEWKFQNIDITTTATVAAGDTIWVMVQPGGTSAVIKSSYTLFGEQNG